MQKHFLKFRKVFTNFAFSPLILISNNSELAARYLSNEVEQLNTSLEIKNINNNFFQRLDTNHETNFFIAENKKNTNQESVLI